VCTGAYAGDDELILATCEAAVERGIAIGAQVGYPDRDSFGRRPMEYAPSVLTAELARQIQYVDSIARSLGAAVNYVKPHGALYHRIITDPLQARALRAALGDLPLMAMARTRPGGQPPHIAEGFADRGYADDTTLISRGQPGDLITEPDAVATQVVRLLGAGVDSICVHSDSPDAVALARAARLALEAAGAEVRHR
jgi:UPF0271 protein